MLVFHQSPLLSILQKQHQANQLANSEDWQQGSLLQHCFLNLEDMSVLHYMLYPARYSRYRPPTQLAQPSAWLCFLLVPRSGPPAPARTPPNCSAISDGCAALGEALLLPDNRWSHGEPVTVTSSVLCKASEEVIFCGSLSSYVERNKSRELLHWDLRNIT